VLHFDRSKLILSQVVELYKIEKFLALGEAARICLCQMWSSEPAPNQNGKAAIASFPRFIESSSNHTAGGIV
jgi:hypothetical protein